MSIAGEPCLWHGECCTFKSIHTTIPGLQVGEKVPIPDHPKVVVDYEHLITLRRKGVTESIPEGLDDPINVTRLLEGVEPVPQTQALRAEFEPERTGPSKDFELQQTTTIEMNFYGNVQNVVGNVGGDFNVNPDLQTLAETAFEIQSLLEQLNASNPTAANDNRKSFVNLMVPAEHRQAIARTLKPG